MKLVCNKCKKESDMNDIGIRNAIVSETGFDVHIKYFCCPECQEPYIFDIETPATVKMNKKLMEAQKAFRDAPIPLYSRRVEDTKKAIIVQQKKLYKKYFSALILEVEKK